MSNSSSFNARSIVFFKHSVFHNQQLGESITGNQFDSFVDDMMKNLVIIHNMDGKVKLFIL
jgi:hypothetical protein